MITIDKVVRIGTVPLRTTYRIESCDVFCKIYFDGRKLSITGVEGPRPNGDCWGSCGQLEMSLRGDLHRITPALGWDLDMLRRFFDVWHEWHMNEMCAFDVEMKAAGWRELAQRPVDKHFFVLTSEASKARAVAKEAALEALQNGVPFAPTEQQTAMFNLPYFKEVLAYPGEEVAPPERYERAKHSRTGDLRLPERTVLGWVKPEEHPDGLLGRRLRPDGPAYGSAWFYHEVPADVIDFLVSLPVTDIQPAWV
jgi:hypothetical protein